MEFIMDFPRRGDDSVTGLKPTRCSSTPFDRNPGYPCGFTAQCTSTHRPGIKRRDVTYDYIMLNLINVNIDLLTGKVSVANHHIWFDPLSPADAELAELARENCVRIQ